MSDQRVLRAGFMALVCIGAALAVLWLAVPTLEAQVLETVTPPTITGTPPTSTATPPTTTSTPPPVTGTPPPVTGTPPTVTGTPPTGTPPTSTSTPPTSTTTPPAPTGLNGTVSDGTNPLGGAAIVAKNTTTDTEYNTVSASNGTYIILAPAGSYVVSAARAGYSTVFYNGQPNEASANPVIVNDGALTSGISFVLNPLATLNGTVTLSLGDTATIPLQVTIRPQGGGTPIYDESLMIDNTGTFTVSDLPAGTYDITVRVANALTDTETVVLTAGVNAYDFGQQRQGDVNSDNTINLGDFTPLAAAFGAASDSPNYTINADFNRDGVINLLDFTVFAANFGASGN